MKVVILSNINWDTTDGCDDDEFESEDALNSLPETVTFNVTDFAEPDEVLDDDELEEHAVDHLCDEYGFCIFGCDIEIKEVEDE